MSDTNQRPAEQRPERTPENMHDFVVKGAQKSWAEKHNQQEDKK